MKKLNTKNILLILTILIVVGIYILISLFGIKALIVIGVVFVVLIIFLLMNATKLSNKAYESRFIRLKECKKCKKIIPGEAVVCPSCGTKF